MRTSRFVSALAPVLALTVAAGACDDGGITEPDGLDDGTFEASVTGGLSADLSGDAVFGSFTDFDDEYVIISLREAPVTGTEEKIVLVGRTTPAEGTFDLEIPEAGDLVAGEWYAVYVRGTSEAGFDNFVASGTTTATGTVTFDEVSSTVIAGTVSFEGDDFFGAGVTQVDAEFVAEPGTIEELISD